MAGFEKNFFVAIMLVSVSIRVKSDTNKHRYHKGDSVPLYANKIAPIHNPSETYAYYSLPFCRSDPLIEKNRSLGEVLNGDCLVSAPFKLDFLIESDSQVFCRKNLTRVEVSQFRAAIAQDYFWEMYYDDLPLWEFIGKVHREEKTNPKEYKYFIHTYMNFDIFYSEDYVIEISARMDPSRLVDITKDKYTNEEELDDTLEETGWKVLHGEVFRYPKHKSLLAAAIGSGTQLLIVAATILLLGIIGVSHPHDRGVIKIVWVMTYVIAYGVAGFIAVCFYHQLEGINWKRNLLLTGCLFSGPFSLVFCFINAVATAYGTTTALPFSTIAVIFLVWMLLACPLLWLGAKSGKAINLEFQAPCHTTKCPREIPALPWYSGILPQVAFAGLLPFNVIYIELHHILAAVWGHGVYTLYGTICIVFILAVIITALISIFMTYIQLAAEDHRWCGGPFFVVVQVLCISMATASTISFSGQI